MQTLDPSRTAADMIAAGLTPKTATKRALGLAKMFRRRGDERIATFYDNVIAALAV